MIDVVSVEVRTPCNDFNDRERQILKVLLLQLCTTANARITAQPMAMNPVNDIDNNVDTLFHVELCFVKSISPEQATSMMEIIERTIQTSMKMCGKDDIDILVNAH